MRRSHFGKEALFETFGLSFDEPQSLALIKLHQLSVASVQKVRAQSPTDRVPCFKESNHSSASFPEVKNFSKLSKTF